MGLKKTTKRGGAPARAVRTNQRLDNRGQSTIEYLIVTFTLVVALVSFPSIYDVIGSTVKNKYHSYSFAVAVSDPPRKAFDDRVSKDVDKIENILNVFEDIEDLMRDSILPDLKQMKMPAWKDVEKFGKLIRSFF